MKKMKKGDMEVRGMFFRFYGTPQAVIDYLGEEGEDGDG